MARPAGGVNPSRITIIPHGIDATAFPLTTVQPRLTARESLKLDPQSTVALYVGRLEDPKNEDWLAGYRDPAADSRLIAVAAWNGRQ